MIVGIHREGSSWRYASENFVSAPYPTVNHAKRAAHAEYPSASIRRGGDMSGRWDEKRWIQNEDGSYSRNLVGSAAVVPESESEEIDATAGALDLARKSGLDLAGVTGSGKDGRITKADVEALLAE